MIVRYSFGFLICSLLFLSPRIAACAPPFVLPSFQVEEAAWSSTHIVVVSEGEALDGVVKVLEVWKGKMKKGIEIEVPGLKSYSNVGLRTVHSFGNAKPTGTVLDGKRIILFLKKDKNVWKGTRDQRFGGIGLSSAWVQNGHVHTLVQIQRSGSQRFHKGQKEVNFREDVFALTKIQRKLDQAAKQKNPKLKIKALKEVSRSSSRVAVTIAIKHISELKAPKNKEILLELLSDPNLKSVAALRAGYALEKLIKKEAYPIVFKALQNEHKYWKELDPKTVKPGGDGIHDKVNKLQYLMEIVSRSNDLSYIPEFEAIKKLAFEIKPFKYHKNIIKYTVESAIRRMKKANETKKK